MPVNKTKPAESVPLRVRTGPRKPKVANDPSHTRGPKRRAKLPVRRGPAPRASGFPETPMYAPDVFREEERYIGLMGGQPHEKNEL